MEAMANIAQNAGGTTAASGILIVFAGLILIAFCIFLFNLAFMERKEADVDGSPAGDAAGTGSVASTQEVKEEEPIPEDDLAALAALIELYRRVHFDALQSDITFVRGQDAANAWRMGYKYGQRHRI